MAADGESAQPTSRSAPRPVDPVDPVDQGAPRWAKSPVSWSDSPLAPMATINGQLRSWVRWGFVEGLCRIATLAMVVLALGLTTWLTSWIPYGVLFWSGLTSGDVVSREDYEDLVDMGRPLWMLWVPAAVALLASAWLAVRTVRHCRPLLSSVERRLAEAVLAREHAERAKDEKGLQEAIVATQDSAIAEEAMAVHETATGIRHAPKHVSFYLVVLAFALFAVALVNEEEMYPWHSSVHGPVEAILTTLATALVFGPALVLGIYLGVWWVRGIPVWRYAVAHHLTGKAFNGPIGLLTVSAPEGPGS